MAQAHAFGISGSVVIPAPRPELVLRAARCVVVLFLVVGCCLVALSVASPIRSGAVDRAETNSFGSSTPSSVFSPHVRPVERVPSTPTHFKLRSVRCASPHGGLGTTCFVAG
jgi:hypothetical protein